MLPTPKIVEVQNNLPYSCIVRFELKDPMSVDWVYYAVTSVMDGEAVLKLSKKYIFQALGKHERSTISFAVDALPLKEGEKEIVLSLWSMKDNKNGTVVQQKLKTNNVQKLGKYDTRFSFKKDSGFAPEQIAAYQEKFRFLLPLVEKVYGKSALPATIEIGRTQRIELYVPSRNTLSLKDETENLVHEWIHAQRKQLLFACDKNWCYDENTEMMEEMFAMGASVEVIHLAMQSEEGKVFFPPNKRHNSILGWDYDFRINKNLITTNLQSSQGGMELDLERYQLVQVAYEKLNVAYQQAHQGYFSHTFNTVYYALLEQDQNLRPTKELFYQIIEQLLPKVEGLPARKWLDQQELFDCRILKGVKTWMYAYNYFLHSEYICNLKFYLYETFENGSEWAQGKKLHSLNKEKLQIKITNLSSGTTHFNSTLPLTPSVNPPDYQNFSSVRINLTTKEVLADSYLIQLAKYNYDYDNRIQTINLSIQESGLYQIEIHNATHNVTQKYYRILGNTVQENRGCLFIAFPHLKKGRVSIRHSRMEGVIEGAFDNYLYIVKAGFCGMTDEVRNIRHSLPGTVYIDLKDEAGRVLQQFVRNIDLGNQDGSYMFLCE